ncbi:MAG: FAD synthase [Candidatus Falkowbacteria bacterium GW2011_GWF2_43_32]|nr:MAG: FAD synthase [Candidatus Falkowbacteria bacterium GW2011_GWF2_43_32]
MVFGTFDNLHPGHLDYFRQARFFGEKMMKRSSVKSKSVNNDTVKKEKTKYRIELIVIVARDKNVWRSKGYAAQEDEKTRTGKVTAALKKMKTNITITRPVVDGRSNFHGRAVLGGLKNRWSVLKKYRPDLICLGYDQKVDLRKLKDEIAKFRLCCKIKRMKAYHPEKYKSSYCRARGLLQ